MLQTISILIKGKVQGVFFRQSTKDIAIIKGINGQVKNLKDGSVHIIATGTEEQLNELLEWCRQGPPTAVVSHVTTEKIALQLFDSFRIVR